MSNFDKLTRLINRYPSQAKLQMYRNLCFGGAGTATLILLVIFQSGRESTALTIAEVGAASAIPLWLGVGGLYEYYILIGPRSYVHYRQKFVELFGPIFFLFGGLGLLAAIGGVLYELQQVALYAFLGGIGLSIIVAVALHHSLANALFENDEGTGENDT